MLFFVIKILGMIRGMIGIDIKNKAVCDYSNQIDENFKAYALKAANQNLDDLQLSIRPYIIVFLVFLLVTSGVALQVVNKTEHIYSSLLFEAAVFSYVLFFGFKSIDEITEHVSISLPPILRFFCKSFYFINVSLLAAAGFGLLGKNVGSCCNGIILVNEVIFLGFFGSLIIIVGVISIIPNAISYTLLYVFRLWLRLSTKTTDPFKNFLRYAGITTLFFSTATTLIDLFLI